MKEKILRIADKVCELIKADSPLASWVAENFSSRLTVKQGFHYLSDVKQDWLPLAVVVIGDDEEGGSGETRAAQLVVSAVIDQADHDPAVAQERIVTLARKISRVFEEIANARLDGLAVWTSAGAIKTDAGSVLPRLVRTVSLSVLYEDN